MNYIQQAYKGEFRIWKYLFIPAAFFGLMILNYLAIELLELDVDKIIQNQIAEKGENRFLVENLLPLGIGLILLLLWVRYIHKQSITSLTTARKRIDWKRFWFAFLFWGAISSALVFLDIYMNPDDYIWNFQLQPFIILCVIAITLIPLQTSFEEYLFRGYLMQGIGVTFKSKWIPLVVTSLTFGILHIANPEVEQLGYLVLVYYIGTGFFLGITTLMDDGLELALGFHAANNLFTALLITADWTVIQTPSIYKDLSEPTAAGFFDVFMPVFIFFPIILFIFAKKYKWTNCKEKLFGRVDAPPKEDYKILED